MEKRWQKQITLTPEQREFVESNLGKMDIGSIAKMLGLGYNKVHNNLRLMGKVKLRPKAKVVQMKGYFDVDTFYKENYRF
jgi:hypothetical protein